MLKQLENTELSQILESCPMGMALSDEHSNITWVNDTFEKYLGISADDIAGHSIDELPDVLQPLFTSSSAVHIPENDIHEDQWYMCSQKQLNGNTVHFITDVAPLHLLMEERETLKDELREALALDEVTGMPNKVALFQSLEPQISRSRRYNNMLSIVIMQVNNVEQLDETQSANLMLPVSQMLNDQVRWADIVGKLNGSDFLLVLPETNEEACKNLSDNLAERLSNLAIPEGLPSDFKLSASFGYVEWTKGDDLSLLMLKARKNLK